MNTQIAFFPKLAAVAVALILTSHVSAGDVIVDDALGLTLTLPDGFVPNPDLVGAAPRIVHGFVLGDPTDDELDIILLIEKMRGTIGPERLTSEDLPPSFQGRLFTTQWQEFEVEAFEVPEQLGEIHFVTYNVQIPLKRAAIQVKLFGPVDRESEMKSLLTEILAGLKGESNWIPSAVPFLPTASSENYGVVLLAFAIVVVLGGLVLLYLVSRKSQKNNVLAIAIVIYCVGLGLASYRVREVMMLSGALKMLGFAGGILGIVDHVRKRNSENLVKNVALIIFGLLGGGYAIFGFIQFIQILGEADSSTAPGGSRIAASVIPICMGLIVCLACFRSAFRKSDTEG